MTPASSRSAPASRARKECSSYASNWSAGTATNRAGSPPTVATTPLRANDWSTLDLKTILGAPAGTAAFAYGTFAATMTTGRLLADRVSRRFGSAAVLRYGAATGAVGITVVALSPWIWMALAGWALFGLGLSGCVPQLFSAAGHADPAAAGTNVSRVAGLGYLGMLTGPAAIGWMTRLVALNYTFLFPALLLVIAAATAGILRSGTEREPKPGPKPEMAQRP